MWKTIVRRILILIPQLLVLSLAIFIVAQFMEGDAFGGLQMANPDITAADIAFIQAEMGLDRPWPVQYVEWLGRLVRLDFGLAVTPVFGRRPVIEIVAERAANTFRLSLLMTVFAYLIAIPLGVIAGRWREKVIDKTIIIYTFFALAMPTIIFAILNLWIFAFTLGWFPAVGSVDASTAAAVARGEAPRIDLYLSRLHHLILPALTGALLATTGIINFLRDRIIDCENSDFVTTARSKGVPRRVVYNRHIFKNASLPIVAGFGPAVAGLLFGSIFIERVFSFHGMGTLFLTAIGARDFPIVSGIAMIYAVLIVVGILLGDLFMMILDPRIRIQ